MRAVGIICEYNPFHNGHLYHIKKVKELFPNCVIICVMSGNFVERGEPSILNKWDKTALALTYGVDLVIELPFAFASQSADLFCKGSVELLDALHVEYLVFGSECSDINLLTQLADLQLTSEYDEAVKKYMKEGNNYPTAMSKAFKPFFNQILGPNDTLGIGYIRELKKRQSSIIPFTIKRTNDYHSINLNSSIVSATAIRTLLKENGKVDAYLPYSIDGKTLHWIDDYFPLLKYKIISDSDLSIYQTVDEGLENRLKKYILDSHSCDELIQKVKTKRYTYHKLSRMLVHILTSFTKEEAKKMKEITYIRVLGFNQKGQTYLRKIKKNCFLPILTTYERGYPILELESRTSFIYDESLEYKQKPIQK